MADGFKRHIILTNKIKIMKSFEEWKQDTAEAELSSSIVGLISLLVIILIAALAA
jgi:hypothetical protein